MSWWYNHCTWQLSFRHSRSRTPDTSLWKLKYAGMNFINWIWNILCLLVFVSDRCSYCFKLYLGFAILKWCLWQVSSCQCFELWFIAFHICFWLHVEAAIVIEKKRFVAKGKKNADLALSGSTPTVEIDTIPGECYLTFRFLHVSSFILTYCFLTYQSTWSKGLMKPLIFIQVNSTP